MSCFFFFDRVCEENGNLPTSVELAASLKIADGFIDKVKDGFIPIMEGEMNYERDVRSKSNEQFTEHLSVDARDNGKSRGGIIQGNDSIAGEGYKQNVDERIAGVHEAVLRGEQVEASSDNETIVVSLLTDDIKAKNGALNTLTGYTLDGDSTLITDSIMSERFNLLMWDVWEYLDENPKGKRYNDVYIETEYGRFPLSAVTKDDRGRFDWKKSQDKKESLEYEKELGFSLSAPTDYPSTYDYTYESPITGQEETSTLPFVRLIKKDEGWHDGFSATLTFNNIEGVYFDLNGHEIEYNPNSISLTANDYASIVKMLGLNPSEYRLSSCSWAGAPYVKDGVTCRDALILGQQYGAMWVALYADEVVVEDSTYIANATYVATKTLSEDEADPEYVIEATGYYVNTVKPLTVALLITAIIATAFALGIWYYMVFVFGKKKKYKEDKKPVRENKQFAKQNLDDNIK